MPNALSAQGRAVTVALKTALRVAGQDVDLLRGGNRATVRAMRGATRFQTTRADGTTIEFESTDWLMPVDCLPWPPLAAGDKVRVAVSETDTDEYVASHPAGEQVWRFVDPGRTFVRLHTRHVEANVEG